MVNVRQHDSAAPIIDEAAEVQFARAWRTYAKLVDNDYVFHREVYAILHRILVEDFPGPFRFLDLACGDARGIVGALQGTTVAHYHGVDLSRPALDMASAAVEALRCPVELDQRDFVAAMADRPEPADAVWIGLSLHHLQRADKLVIIARPAASWGVRASLCCTSPPAARARAATATSSGSPSPPAALWSALSAEEWAFILDHVTHCDFPETPSGWMGLGRTAGFGRVEQEFVAPTDLYRMFRSAPSAGPDGTGPGRHPRVRSRSPGGGAW